MDKFFEEIGRAALEIASVGVEVLLIYAEVEDGVISADIFFKPVASPTVQFRFATPAVRQQIYDYWANGSLNSTPNAWSAMEYVVRNGKFTADFKYQEDFFSEESLHDRRPRVVAATFSGATVDYSRPR